MKNESIKIPFYNRFRWKLTFSYMFASVLAAILVTLLGTFIGVFVFYQTPLWKLVISQETLNLTPQIREEMRNPSNHRAEITTWLSNLSDGLGDPKQFRKTGFSFSLDKTELEVKLLVADINGRIIAKVPEKLEAESLQDILSPETQKLFELARKGETNPELLAVTENSNSTTAIVPIFDEDGKILGLMMSQIRLPFNFSLLVKNVFEELLPNLAIITFFALIFGAIFGFLTARKLTKRFQTFSTAATAWESGNFNETIIDNRKDELSRLAFRLNQMALELKNLFVIKENLATLEERNRLARDLHDTVKQQIFAANMQLSAAQEIFEQDKTKAQNHMFEAKKLVKDVQRELNLLINELRPICHSKEDFNENLKNIIKDWNRQNQVDLKSEIEELDELDSKTQHQIICILQETLSNIARHSEASKVEVILKKVDDKKVLLTISDNGKGFDISKNSVGMGLQNIRERCDSLNNGKLEISSKKNTGTSFEISWSIDYG